MSLSKKELVELALHESKDFAKDAQKYFDEIGKIRELTEQEKRFYVSTDKIHIRIIDSLIIIIRKELKQEIDMKDMKIFGYKTNSNYGITYGIIIVAKSYEEAKNILGVEECEKGEEIFEIPLDKGYTLIGFITR